MKTRIIMCLPRAICNHMIGENHHIGHRMAVGTVVMAIGVTIAKASAGIEYAVIHISLDMVGYGLHALGCTPFIDAMIKGTK